MNAIKSLAFAAFIIFLAGCSDSNEPSEVIDLNKVLDVMVSTLDQMQAKMGGEAGGTQPDQAAREKFMQEFNVQYALNLNEAKLLSKPLGTAVQKDGSISGFVDPNQNMQRDSGENQLFTVEIDEERSRLIATDTQNGHRRDHGFSLGALAAGMLIGHLLSRQRAAGVNRGKFSNMKMSPRNYHSSAAAKAKASARAKSGSGSFSRGK